MRLLNYSMVLISYTMGLLNQAMGLLGGNIGFLSCFGGQSAKADCNRFRWIVEKRTLCFFFHGRSGSET